MARIRTVKPEFWTSAQVLECSTNARLMFIGLWNFADDKGRHPASPKQIKAEIFPADDFSLSDISAMLEELESNQLVRTYTVENKDYLEVCGWRHQRIDKPQPSKYPAPLQEHSGNVPRTFPPDRIGKDTIVEERKGKDGNGKDSTAGATAPPTRKKREPVTNETWAAYCRAYLQRYGTEPVRNASVNGQLAQFVKRVGAKDAPHIAEYFVGLNQRWYVTKGHSVSVMLPDAEKLATEWKTNTSTTEAQARQADQTESNRNVFQKLLKEERAKHA